MTHAALAACIADLRCECKISTYVQLIVCRTLQALTGASRPSAILVYIRKSYDINKSLDAGRLRPFRLITFKNKSREV